MHDRGKHYEEVESLELASKNVEERRLDANVLCARCNRGMVYRRRGSLEVVVYCHALSTNVPPDIIECSAFRDPKAMDLDDMNKLALRVDKREGINDKSYI